MGEYAVSGAMLTCNKGTIPSPFTGTLGMMRSINGKTIGTEGDKIPFVNIKPFGICTILTKTVPIPCVPAPTFWQKVSEGVSVNGQKVLLEDSCIKCAVGGKISFNNSGQ